MAGRGLLKLIALLLVCSGVSSVSVVSQNHHDVTVKVGDQVTLVCTADRPIQFCSFRSPNGNIVIISEDANYDRIKKLTGSPNDCGIEIVDLADEDHGKWECSITARNENGRSTSGSSFISVTVAVAPTDVSLVSNGEPVTSSQIEVKVDESSKKDIGCIARNARPKPVFKWFIGGNSISGDVVDSEENPTADGKADFTQVFSYIADPSHNGQKLRCYVEHLGYTEAQIESQENTVEADLELLFKPQQNPKEVQEYYELVEGGKNTIRMMFRANPKPSSGEWQVSGQTIAVGEESGDKKFQSTPIEEDGFPGQYIVSLTISDLSKDDVDKENLLQITNDEGTTDYKFILRIGSQPPTDVLTGMPIAKQDASASGPIIGIVILVIVLILLVVLGVIARVKGILCFAAKRKGEDTEKAVDKEGSETESADDNTQAAVENNTQAPTTEITEESEDTIDHKANGTSEEPIKKGPTVSSRFTNFLTVVKKSVASKGSNTKDKYAANEADVEAKQIEDGNTESDKEEITYADIDKTALGPGSRRPNESVESDDEKTRYAVIQA